MHYHWLHAPVAENQFRQVANLQSSSAPAAVKFKSNATANAANSDAYTNAPNAASKDHKR
jgi:hypothetical protein